MSLIVPRSSCLIPPFPFLIPRSSFLVLRFLNCFPISYSLFPVPSFLVPDFLFLVSRSWFTDFRTELFRSFPLLKILAFIAMLLKDSCLFLTPTFRDSDFYGKLRLFPFPVIHCFALLVPRSSIPRSFESPFLVQGCQRISSVSEVCYKCSSISTVPLFYPNSVGKILIYSFVKNQCRRYNL